MKLLSTVELFIPVPQTYTICGGIYMQINSLPAGGAVGAGEIEVSLVTLYTKQSSAALSDIIYLFSHLADAFVQSDLQMRAN